MAEQLLLVEDDELLGEGTKIGLSQSGFGITWAKDGLEALESLKESQFDLIILDLGLPNISGLEVLEQIRTKGNQTPVLILTARDSTEDTVTGLDTGADDYLTKPFDLDELSARVRALIRRTNEPKISKITYKNVCLYPNSQTVTLEGKIVSITRREYTLLHKLIENQGKVLPREVLLENVYGGASDVDSNVLEVHIHSLRKKLNASFIRTIRGIGYLADKV